jgi:hypothetical protein
VIHLLPPLSLHGRFSAQDLPAALQLPLLHNLVAPRIVSSSMRPTIQEGDRLALSPPTVLTVGTIAVFRNDTLLICHRIIAVNPDGTLSTRGDAAQGADETVQPGSVIGVVKGVIRKGRHMSLGQSAHRSSAPAHRTGFKNPVRTFFVQAIIQSVRILVRVSLFQYLLAILFRWTATVDVLAPSPLRFLPSYSRIASFTLRRFPCMDKLLVASDGQNSPRHVFRLGPWRLAQYDPATESLLLRQSLQDAGLEPFIRSLLR